MAAEVEKQIWRSIWSIWSGTAEFSAEMGHCCCLGRGQFHTALQRHQWKILAKVEDLKVLLPYSGHAVWDFFPGAFVCPCVSWIPGHSDCQPLWGGFIQPAETLFMWESPYRATQVKRVSLGPLSAGKRNARSLWPLLVVACGHWTALLSSKPQQWSLKWLWGDRSVKATWPCCCFTVALFHISRHKTSPQAPSETWVTQCCDCYLMGTNCWYECWANPMLGCC